MSLFCFYQRSLNVVHFAQYQLLVISIYENNVLLLKLTLYNYSFKNQLLFNKTGT